MSTASSPCGFDESFPADDLVLPDDMREELARPFGELVGVTDLNERIKGARRVITVGDVVTTTLLDLGIEPDLAVFDYKTQRSIDCGSRNRIETMSGTLVTVVNPAGKITPGMWRAVRDAARSDARTKVKVEGEEDLAALVAIAYAPEGAQIIYGIPNKGLAVVDVNGESRAFATAAINRMIR
ncbi:MAG: DUF359 domain-containing protein [Candidatus Thermoplasmatota archaeon]|nr:DUF359 domain-containing protein [Candidatus Thermoplasmatota archaeon]